MALIECPNCKNKVSDTKGKCFICGQPLPTANKSAPEKINSLKDIITQKNEKEKSYDSLAPEEQDKLFTEFYEINPKYWKLKNNMYNAQKIATLSYLNLFAVFCYRLIKYIFFKNKEIINEIFYNISAAICISLLVIGLITVVICLIKIKSDLKKDLIVLKRYQAWLKKEKQIDYLIKFSRKQRKSKKFFEKINLENELY